jgi:hypothetical protein
MSDLQDESAFLPCPLGHTEVHHALRPLRCPGKPEVFHFGWGRFYLGQCIKHPFSEDKLVVRIAFQKGGYYQLK